MSNVTYLDTCLDLPVDRVLDAEEVRKCERVVVLGTMDDGMLYFATSTGDVAEINLMLDRAKLVLVSSVVEP